MTFMTQNFKTRAAEAGDLADIARLNAQVFGPGRLARSAYRVREGKGMMSRFCRVAHLDGILVASLRMTEILIGGEGGAALLGPLAVHPEFKGKGFGRRLAAEAIDEMRAAGLKIVVLVGDEPYYGKLGFRPVPVGQITFPGPVNPARILAIELTEQALGAYSGIVTAACGS